MLQVIRIELPINTGLLIASIGALVLCAGCTTPVPSRTPDSSLASPPTSLSTSATDVSPEPSQAGPPVEATSHDLTELPVMPVVSERAREIYRRGLDGYGRNPNTFSKVGDCLTASDYYLFPIGRGIYDLGEYGYLQAAIDHFSSTGIREIDGESVNSFSNPSLTASCGFNSASPLDPIWANPNWCDGGQTPLMCEYEVSNASLSLIILGTHDMYYSTETYKGYLETIVAESIENGVLPVLFTFPTRLDRIDDVVTYNRVMVDLAMSYEIPVVNFWRALQELPNYGIAPGQATRLSMPEDGCSTCFTEQNLEAGTVLQNWIALEALYQVWTQVSTN